MPSLSILFYTILLLRSCAFLPLYAQNNLIAPLSFGCSETAGNYTANSTFQHNLNQLFLSLIASVNHTGFNSTSVGRPPDQVFGIALCHGDAGEACQSCLRNASANAFKACPYAKAGVVRMELCYLRYSTKNSIGYMRCNPYDISDPALFFQKLRVMIQNLTSTATTYPADLMFASGSIAYNDFRTIYGMVQCKRDQSIADCRTCLTRAMNNLTGFCKAKQGAQFRGWGCDLRYELYPFVSAPTGGPALSPLPQSPPAKALSPSIDPTKSEQLQWEVRSRMIGGIARALRYLQEDSRLKIIDRDLKASNILLDEDMDPKISDFGFAMLCGADEAQENTRKIAGT